MRQLLHNVAGLASSSGLLRHPALDLATCGASMRQLAHEPHPVRWCSPAVRPGRPDAQEPARVRNRRPGDGRLSRRRAFHRLQLDQRPDQALGADVAAVVAAVRRGLRLADRQRLPATPRGGTVTGQGFRTPGRTTHAWVYPAAVAAAALPGGVAAL